MLGSPALTAHTLDDKNHPSGGGFDFDETLEPLPKAQSDAVVVSSVTAFQPFLARNSSSDYTELTLSVDKIIKDSAGTIQQGGSITILKLGGTLFVTSVLHVAAKA